MPDRFAVDARLLVPGNLAAVVAKGVCELLPAFGHSAANPTNPSALLAQLRPYLVLLALSVVPHSVESIAPFR